MIDLVSMESPGEIINIEVPETHSSSSIRSCNVASLGKDIFKFHSPTMVPFHMLSLEMFQDVNGTM
jgi:hypothetical protein